MITIKTLRLLPFCQHQVGRLAYFYKSDLQAAASAQACRPREEACACGFVGRAASPGLADWLPGAPPVADTCPGAGNSRDVVARGREGRSSLAQMRA